jgi:signal peptidase I
MDKKTAAILVLIVLVGITGIGWLKAWLNPTLESTRDLTKIFHGYTAYLDREISYHRISGSSMKPTFRDGDVVLSVKVDPAELVVGDIIIYQPKPTVHRIIEVGVEGGKYWFRTQGDGSGFPDPGQVWEDDVQGLVIGVIYQGGS